MLRRPVHAVAKTVELIGRQEMAFVQWDTPNRSDLVTLRTVGRGFVP
jgi:hypothetical protein